MFKDYIYYVTMNLQQEQTQENKPRKEDDRMTKIEYLRRKMGWSQTKMAQLMGLSSSNLTLVERGHRKAWPNLMQKISEVLEVDQEELFDEEGNPIELVINGE
jgi:transcriptional regulator with XRE-family HTH domain